MAAFGCVGGSSFQRFLGCHSGPDKPLQFPSVLADAIVAMEYGELVKSLLNCVDAGQMTLEEVLATLTNE